MRRRTARVLVLDPAGRVLLLQGRDPVDPRGPTFWFTPGGGCEGDETPEQAGLRELFEETGIVLDALGPVRESRRNAFMFDGAPVEQDEHYFLVRLTNPATSTPTELTPLEQRYVLGSRWWTPAELAQTTELHFPEDLCVLVRRWSG